MTVAAVDLLCERHHEERKWRAALVGVDLPDPPRRITQEESVAQWRALGAELLKRQELKRQQNG